MKNANDEQQEEEHGGQESRTSAELMRLLMPQLKEECRSLGLPVYGSKKELVQRLLQPPHTQDEQHQHQKQKQSNRSHPVVSRDSPSSSTRSKQAAAAAASTASSSPPSTRRSVDDDDHDDDDDDDNRNQSTLVESSSSSSPSQPVKRRRGRPRKYPETDAAQSPVLSRKLSPRKAKGKASVQYNQDGTVMLAEFDTWTTTQLRNILKEMGVPIYGDKATLVRRYNEAITNGGHYERRKRGNVGRKRRLPDSSSSSSSSRARKMARGHESGSSSSSSDRDDGIKVRSSGRNRRSISKVRDQGGRVFDLSDEEADNDGEEEADQVPVKRKRGRPPKALQRASLSSPQTPPSAGVRRVGRPRKDTRNLSLSTTPVSAARRRQKLALNAADSYAAASSSTTTHHTSQSSYYSPSTPVLQKRPVGRPVGSYKKKRPETIVTNGLSSSSGGLSAYTPLRSPLTAINTDTFQLPASGAIPIMHPALRRLFETAHPLEQLPGTVGMPLAFNPVAPVGSVSTPKGNRIRKHKQSVDESPLVPLMGGELKGDLKFYALPGTEDLLVHEYFQNNYTLMKEYGMGLGDDELHKYSAQEGMTLAALTSDSLTRPEMPIQASLHQIESELQQREKQKKQSISNAMGERDVFEHPHEVTSSRLDKNITEITVADAHLRKIVTQSSCQPSNENSHEDHQQQQQQQSESNTLERSTIKTLTFVHAARLNVESLLGIQYLTNLQVLDLNGNNISKLRPLSHLRHLRELNLSHNNIHTGQLRHLRRLWRLEVLDLSYNKLTNLYDLFADSIDPEPFIQEDDDATDVESESQDNDAVSNVGSKDVMKTDINKDHALKKQSQHGSHIKRHKLLLGRELIIFNVSFNPAIADLSPVLQNQRVTKLQELNASDCSVKFLAMQDHVMDKGNSRKKGTRKRKDTSQKSQELSQQQQQQQQEQEDEDADELRKVEFDCCETLQALYLCHNDLVDLQHIHLLHNLKELSLRGNTAVLDIGQVVHLFRLYELNLLQMPYLFQEQKFNARVKKEYKVDNAAMFQDLERNRIRMNLKHVEQIRKRGVRVIV